jgi:DeoR family suf operon transcriptional repressor
MKLPAEPSDRAVIDYLRSRPGSTIADLVQFLGVTATAVRQRLTRLMASGLLARDSAAAGRGRPVHRYSLTPLGVRSAGTNYNDLAQALWAEIREVRDPEIRRGLLQRISQRLADVYRSRLQGENVRERMASLAALMSEYDMPFAVGDDDSDKSLPVLTALACPYPDLAEQDRSICAMERMLFSDMLGESVRLSACRLEGSTCCTFEASAAPAGA